MLPTRGICVYLVKKRREKEGEEGGKVDQLEPS